jgi:hypothetical protein
VQLVASDEGRGLLQVAYDAEVAPLVRAQIEQFVQLHLVRRATPGTVVRERRYSCPDCGAPFGREQVRAAVERGRTSMLCPVDETRVWLEEASDVRAVAGVTREMDSSADAARVAAAASSVLRGKIETDDFDVLVSYHGPDREAARALAGRLRERGILPWLDVDELRPGLPWQPELEQRLESVRSVAVLVGADGIGPWQNQEVMASHRALVERGCPAIPVLLPGGHKPTLPLFLRGMTWVDLADGEAALNRLIWGITGEKPDPFS